MGVVHIRYMWMCMAHRFVPMPMRVWFPQRIARTVFVLMMEVVGVRMRMFYRFMLVFMLVILGQMQPHTDRH